MFVMVALCGVSCVCAVAPTVTELCQQVQQNTVALEYKKNTTQESRTCVVTWAMPGCSCVCPAQSDCHVAVVSGDLQPPDVFLAQLLHTADLVVTTRQPMVIDRGLGVQGAALLRECHIPGTLPTSQMYCVCIHVLWFLVCATHVYDSHMCLVALAWQSWLMFVQCRVFATVSAATNLTVFVIDGIEWHTPMLHVSRL